MKMTQDFLLLKIVEGEESLVVLSPVEQAKQDAAEGKKGNAFVVLDAGPGRWEFGKWIETEVKKGDMVLISMTVKLSPKHEKGKVYTIGKSRDVMAIYGK
jgi:co-chaperonin GroES (HSP10)